MRTVVYYNTSLAQASFISAICGRISTQEYSIETQKSPADLADLRRQATKQQNCNNCNNCNNLKQPVFLCGIMQLAAFLCVISAICGRINRQEYSIETPKSPADLADLRR